MMRLRTSTRIRRPAQDVFGYLIQFDRRPEYLEIAASRQISQGPVEIGTTFSDTIERAGTWEVTHEVTELEPGRRLTYTFAIGPHHGVMRWFLEPVGGESELAVEAEIHTGRGYRLVLRMAEPMLRKVLADAARDLAGVLDQP